MEEIKIKIPEGMEIDVKETDLEKGIIRLKKKESPINWDYIYNNLVYNDRVHFDTMSKCGSRVQAYAKLYHISKYLNGCLYPSSDTVRWVIKEHGSNYTTVGLTMPSYAGSIYFRTPEDAQSAINIMGKELDNLFKY